MSDTLWMIVRNPKTGKYHVVDSEHYDRTGAFTGIAHDSEAAARADMNARD